MCVGEHDVDPGGRSLVLSRRRTWRFCSFVTSHPLLYDLNPTCLAGPSNKTSLPKFCITFREMLFLRALHDSQYVVDFKKTERTEHALYLTFRSDGIGECKLAGMDHKRGRLLGLFH